MSNASRIFFRKFLALTIVLSLVAVVLSVKFFDYLDFLLEDGPSFQDENTRKSERNFVSEYIMNLERENQALKSEIERYKKYNKSNMLKLQANATLTSDGVYDLSHLLNSDCTQLGVELCNLSALSQDYHSFLIWISLRLFYSHRDSVYFVPPKNLCFQLKFPQRVEISGIVATLYCIS